MKSDARYTINVEIESDNEGEAVFDRKLFLNHLRRMLDTYSRIGSVRVTLYRIDDDLDEETRPCMKCGSRTPRAYGGRAM